MWEDGKVKLFISHKAEHRGEVRLLSDALREFGIHGFVAHEDIEPTRSWMSTLDTALRSMDALLAFITDGFGSSCWTNQEIGFAISRQIPIIPLKLQAENPPAFISHVQALVVRLDHFCDAAPKIFKALNGEPFAGRMRHGLIQAFAESQSYSDADIRLRRLEEGLADLTDQEVNYLADSYANNSQLYGCILVNQIGLQISCGKRPASDLLLKGCLCDINRR